MRKPPAARIPASRPAPADDPGHALRAAARRQLAFKLPAPAATLRVPVGVRRQEGHKELCHPVEHLSFYGVEATVYSDGSEVWQLPPSSELEGEELLLSTRYRSHGDPELAPAHEREGKLRLPLRDGFERDGDRIRFPATSHTAGRFFTVEYREEEDGTHLQLPDEARVRDGSLYLPLPEGGMRVPSGGPEYRFASEREIVVPLPEGARRFVVVPKAASLFGEAVAAEGETRSYFGIQQSELVSGNVLLQLPRSASLSPGRIALPASLATRGDPKAAPPHVVKGGVIALPLPAEARIQGRNVVIPKAAWDDFFRETTSYFGIEEIEGFDGSLELAVPQGTEILADRLCIPSGAWEPEAARDTAPPYRVRGDGSVEVHLPAGFERSERGVLIPASLADVYVELPVRGDPTGRREYLGIVETRYEDGSLTLELPEGSRLRRCEAVCPASADEPGAPGPDFRITPDGVKLRLPEEVWVQGERVLIEPGAVATFFDAKHVGFGMYLLPVQRGVRLTWPGGTQRVGRRLLLPNALRSGQEPKTIAYNLLDDGKAVVQLPAGVRPGSTGAVLPDSMLAGFLRTVYAHPDGRTIHPPLPAGGLPDGARLIWSELSERERRHLPFPHARAADGRVVMALPEGVSWHEDGSFSAPSDATPARPRTDDLPLATLDPDEAEVSALEDGGVLIELPQRLRPVKEDKRPPTVVVGLKRGIAFSRGAFVHGYLASERKLTAELRIGNLVYELELEKDGQTRLYHPDGLVEALPLGPAGSGADATWPLPFGCRLWLGAAGLPHLVDGPRAAPSHTAAHDIVGTQSFAEFLSICRELVAARAKSDKVSVIGSIGNHGLHFGAVLEQLRAAGNTGDLMVEVEASRGGELEMVVNPGQEVLSAQELVGPPLSAGEWTASVAATLVERHGHGPTPEIEGWVRRYATGDMEVRVAARVGAPILDSIGTHTVGSLEVTADALVWLVEREPELGLALVRKLVGDGLDELLDSSDALAELIEV